MNSIGYKFILTTFGESHGPAIGGVVDGYPSGMAVDFGFIDHELALRNPSTVTGGTTRHETDKIEFLSGIFNGVTLGTPIAYIIRNNDAKPADYSAIRHTYRPGHADYTYEARYGIRDYRGGGRASARETASRVVAGALAQLWLHTQGIRITAFVDQIGDIRLPHPYTHYDLNSAEHNPLRTLDRDIEHKMTEAINKTSVKNDSIGGAVTCVIKGMPAGIGNPVFDKLQASLAHAMLSIPAAKCFEYGQGLNAASTYGSQSNDEMYIENNTPSFRTNYAGGLLGGITTGEDIYFRVVFKPVASIAKPQQTVTDNNDETTITIKGRHDTCIAPRAAAVVKAMTAITLTDQML